MGVYVVMGLNERNVEASNGSLYNTLLYGDSVIINPDGTFIAGPLHEEQGILYAEIDQQQMDGSRWNPDVA
ncbi:MAG: hypothetical protein M3220_22550 [Chloroflexota bacterium]|nr:hypothetical protein [Chloroflexota bacterium]